MTRQKIGLTMLKQAVLDLINNGATTWANITGKPSTFPPETHTHDYVTGITNKPTTFPPAPHTHTIEEIAELDTELNKIPTYKIYVQSATPTSPNAGDVWIW